MSRAHATTTADERALDVARIAYAPPAPAAHAVWSPSMTRLIVAALAVVAGLVATLADVAPTGSPTVDAALVGVTVATVSWLGAAALRWDAALITLVAGIATWSWVGAVIGIVGAAVGFGIPLRPGTRSLVNVTLVGLALNLAARSELDVFLGTSTIVALVLGGYVAAIGFVRRSKRSRRVVAGLALGCAALACAAGFAVAVLGTLAADDLRAGQQLTEDGLTALGEGELDAARVAFTAAADAFDDARARTASRFTAPARVVPIVAQHHRLLADLSAEAAVTSRLIADELGRVDLDALSIAGGGIDVDRVRALEEPLRAINVRIARLELRVAELDSPWLLHPVAVRLDRLAAEVGDQQQRSAEALAAAAVAPALLGGDEPRTYFVGFTTPAEARGSGGFMGNWAEITVTDGRFEMTAFGRADDLNEAGDPSTRKFPTGDTDMDRWLTQYGPFHLASGPGGTTGTAPWKNINMSPDMAATGRAIAALYPQSGGGELDGVFVLDVYALARLLEFTGPIPLPDGAVVDGQTTVTAENAADLLLNDQYDLTETDERIDVLEDFSRAVVATLLGGTLPPPDDLVDVLGPMVEQGRIATWMARAEEHAVLTRLGMTGTLPPAGAGDGLAIVLNNAVGNKIDYYLAADASYSVRADARTSTATATLELTLRNNAPVDGEPSYVIGNPIGLPTGTNRTWVSVFTRLPVQSITLDGEPVQHELGSEAGYFVTSTMVTLAAGERGTLTLELDGTIDVLEAYQLSTRTPPTVAPSPLSIDATWIDVDGGTLRRTEQIGVAGNHRVTVRP